MSPSLRLVGSKVANLEQKEFGSSQSLVKLWKSWLQSLQSNGAHPWKENNFDVYSLNIRRLAQDLFTQRSVEVGKTS